VRCRRVRQNLSAFIDRELESPVRDAINAHLQKCPECRTACARLQKLELLLDESTVPPVPQGLTERIVASASRDVASPNPNCIAPAPVPHRPPERRWYGVSTLMRIAAAVVLVIGLSAGAAMGRFVARTTAAQLTDRPPSNDPATVYNLDSLSATPEDSLAGTYLTLVTAASQSGE